MEYIININEGNEILGMEKTVTVSVDKRIASNRELARQIHNHNRLIPESIILSLIEDVLAATLELVSLGQTVRLKYQGDTFISISPEIRIKGGNINMERARRIDPETTDITPENVHSLVARSGIEMCASVRPDKRFTKKLRSMKPLMEFKEVAVKKKVRKK